jgi:hypothetical protein
MSGTVRHGAARGEIVCAGSAVALVVFTDRGGGSAAPEFEITFKRVPSSRGARALTAGPESMTLEVRKPSSVHSAWSCTRGSPVAISVRTEDEG